MSLSQLFNFTNLAFLFVALVVSKELRYSALKLNSVMKILRAFLLCGLLIFSTVYNAFNTYLLLCCISLFNSRSIFSRKICVVNDISLYVLTASLFLLVYILSPFKSIIWLPAVLNILQYFSFFALAYSIDMALDAKSMTLRVAMLLFISIFFMSKIGLAIVAVASVVLILKYYSSRAMMKMLPLISILLCSTFIARNESIVSAFADRFVREGYHDDEKFFGLSDGARFSLWSHYLGNSQLFGAGQSVHGTVYALIPAHNIFVHLASSAGYVLACIVALLILYSIFSMLTSGFHCFALAISFSLLFSSFGEFPLMWVTSILLVPYVLKKSMPSK